MLLVDLRAGDEVRDLLLLDHLPVDELLDVGMIDVDDHHLGGAARGAARLDGARGAVADLEEAHQAGGFAAAGEPLAFAAQPGEIRAGAGAVFEQPRLAHPQVHDPALVDEIVGDRLDEAGVRLRMLVGGGRLHHFAGLVVDVEMALARPVDAVGPVQAGVEPLRRVRRHHLHREHVAQLVEEGLRIAFGSEIAALESPVGPGAGEAVEHLLARGLADDALSLGQIVQRLLVGDAAPQPGRDALLLDLLQARGHAGLAEIFLRQHVGGDLRPCLRHLDVVGAEDDRAVGIADFARGQPEHDIRVGRLAFFGVAPLDPHLLPLSVSFIYVGTPAEHPLRKGRRQFPRGAGAKIARAFPAKPLARSDTHTPARIEKPDPLSRHAATLRRCRAQPSPCSRRCRRERPRHPFWRARRTLCYPRRTSQR